MPDLRNTWCLKYWCILYKETSTVTAEVQSNTRHLVLCIKHDTLQCSPEHRYNEHCQRAARCFSHYVSESSSRWNILVGCLFLAQRIGGEEAGFIATPILNHGIGSKGVVSLKLRPPYSQEKVVGRWGCWTLSVQQPQRPQPFTYTKPEAASAVLSSWWWALCCPKHVELHTNME